VCLITHTSNTDILPTDTEYWTEVETTETPDAWDEEISYAGSSFLAPTGTAAIEIAIINESNRNTPVELMNRFEDIALPDKTQTGLVSQLYFKRYPTYGRVYVYPTPDREQTLRFSRIRLLEDLDTAGGFPDVPVTLIAYLIYELASEIAEEYDREEAKIARLRNKAQAELALAIRDQKEYSDCDSIAPAY
jgi:hypothetical protein